MPNYNDNPNMVPLMRMSPYGGYHTPVKRYASPDNASPMKKPMEDLSGDGKITQKDVLIGRGVINEDGTPAKRNGIGTKSIKERIYEDGAKKKAALPRKMKFCGGMSKAYGKKK
jgi:hypothetical protein